MSFEARPYFRYTPHEGQRETYVRESPDGSYIIERHVDCSVEVNVHGYIRLIFCVMETDSMDRENFLVFRKDYTSWAAGNSTFPKWFIEKNRYLFKAMELIGSRTDKVAADVVWSIFYELEISRYLTARNTQGCWFKDFFPKAWKFWEEQHENRLLQVVRDVMES